MKADTPLEEVVAHLPRDISAYMLSQPHSRRVAALLQIRLALSVMESRGAQLDPVSYDAVVHTVATMALLTAQQAEMLHDVREELQQVLERVERK